MKIGKRIAGVALAASLALTTVGCSGGDTSWVFEADGIKPPAGVYLIYMVSSASSADEKLTELNKDNAEYVAPAYKDMLKGTLEDQPMDQWIVADAQRQMREYMAVEKTFADMGLTLTEADIETAKSNAANTWSTYGEFYEGNGIAQSSMQTQMENRLKRDAIFQKLYGEGGELAVPDQELKDIFVKTYAKTDLMVFSKKTTGGTPEGTAADAETSAAEAADAETSAAEATDAETKTRAEGYLARLKEGEELEELIFQQEKEEATAENLASITKPEAGSRTMNISESMKGNSYFSDELVDAAMSATVGEPKLVEDENYYYILRRKDILADEAEFLSYRSQLLTELKGDEYEAKLDEWADAMNLTVNQPAVDNYKPSKLVIE